MRVLAKWSYRRRAVCEASARSQESPEKEADDTLSGFRLRITETEGNGCFRSVFRRKRSSFVSNVLNPSLLTGRVSSTQSKSRGDLGASIQSHQFHIAQIGQPRRGCDGSTRPALTDTRRTENTFLKISSFAPRSAHLFSSTAPFSFVSCTT